MKEIKLIKIKGRIINLKIEDSKINPLKNLNSQAAATAVLGTLTASSALMTNTPLMMLAANGIKGKTFTCNVGEYRLAGQFTTVRFKENDPLILVISEDKYEHRHLVYAALEPKAGLLHMMLDMGMSLKELYKSIIKTDLFFLILCLVFFSILYVISLFQTSDAFSLKDLIDYSLMTTSISIILVVAGMISYINIGNSMVKMSKLSENIFELLGFGHSEEQNFFRKYLIDDAGLYRSVMKYRENLKGKDPYPEDYFDKYPIDKN